MDTAWIQTLIENERKQGSHTAPNPVNSQVQAALIQNSVAFLLETKEQFLNVAYTYNQIRSRETGQVKTYSISKTQADFMLFRNGFRLIFTLKQPGHIDIVSSRPSQGLGTDNTLVLEKKLEAKIMTFHDIQWFCDECPVKINSMVKYYFSNFIRISDEI